MNLITAFYHAPFHVKERDAFRALQDIDLIDAYRLFDQPEKSWSWWDYRQLAFQKNRGLRIEALASHCTACTIDRTPRKWTQPSDHTPVIAELDI